MTDRAHLFVVVITLANLGFVLRLVRRHHLRAKYSLLWLSVGVGFVVLAASPRLLERISEWVGIYYAPATLFLGGLVFLFFVVVHFSWELSRLEERTRVLAEETALLRAELEERNDRAEREGQGATTIPSAPPG